MGKERWTHLPNQPFRRCIPREVQLPTVDERIATYTRFVGNRAYECKDHLGNVRAVVSDRRMQDYSQWVVQSAINESFETHPNKDATHARTGNYSLRAEDVDWSLYTVNATQGQSFTISYWVYIENAPTVGNVTNQFSYGTNAQGYGGAQKLDYSKAGQWQKVSYEWSDIYHQFVNWTFSTVNQGTANATPVWIDDIQIEITEGEVLATTDVLSYSDYYAFGMKMPGRSGQAASGKYRYGFNGKESDGEWTDNFGDFYDFGARMYDSRLGRWAAVDPLMAKYSSLSPYNGIGDNPIIFVDLDG